MLCNSLVKFDLFLREAISYGFDAVATGHYARIVESRFALPPCEGGCPKDGGLRHEELQESVFHLLK